ncbi:Fanconi anemia group D2 protein-like [Tropilaelaps mercedesae]|uniref:Fanconi anemia group D2 protein-like n=1 Tax=Tropilaelaps mercedesae TaxID=418985 RepID=A0A1V9X7D4_9ACAR|nr:Fanconi anemia group D2 protein-like [Tropilaelaps mercedesae]
MASGHGGGAAAQLERILMVCGVDMKEGRALSVAVDHREFQKRLRETLIAEKLTPVELADTTRIYFSKDAARFDNGLAPCDASDTSAVVPQMQRDLLKFVLDTLYERALGDENATAVTYGVIQCLKWQDAINDSEARIDLRALIERLFELIADVPEEQQRQLVRALPEMLRENGAHARVAARLCELYEDRSELSGAILEALAALHVPPEVVVSVRKSVLSSVPQLDVPQLCPVLDFVLRNLPEADTPVFVNMLRSSEAIGLASQEVTVQGLDASVGHEDAATTAQAVALAQFVDKLRVGVMTHRALGECWLKMVEANSAGTALKQIDVVFLFACYGQLQQRHVDATIRQAAKEGCLTKTLAANVLRRQKDLLKRYLNNILEICDLLLRSPVVSVHELACVIYEELFLHYDVHVQTEVIVALLTHAGSGLPAELHNALSCVHSLCTQHARAAAPFGFMLQVLVDQLGRMSLGQARLLFRSLSRLAYADDGDDSGLRDTLRIAARKQLINPNLKYKCVGMVATVAIVEAMLPKRSESASGGQQIMSDAEACVRQALNSARLFPAAAALLCDELALAVPLLNKYLVQRLHQIASEEFRRAFVDASEGGGDTSAGVGCSISASAAKLRDDPTFVPNSVKMTINIGRLCRVQDRTQDVGLPIEAMCPLFRLLRAAEMESFSNDPQGINALLFARTLPDDLEERSMVAAPDKEQLLTTLFHTINWNRELINSASEHMNREIRAQLVLTVRKQVALVNLAAQWLARVPDFVPPRVTFEDCVSAQSVHMRTAVKAKPGKGRKRKAPNDENADENPTTKNTPPVELLSFRNFLRGLNQNFVYLLEDEFSPSERAFLLQELQLQLDASLGTDEPQRMSFLPTITKKESTTPRRAPAEVVRFVINFIPQMSTLLETLVGRMRASSERIDDADDEQMGTGDSSLNSDEVICLRLLFSILNSLLAWRGFDEPRNAKVSP